MAYQRPRSAFGTLSKQERAELLREYIAHYDELARQDPKHLNQKIPPGVFSDLLDNIGELLTEEARRRAREPGPVLAFLDANPLPGRWNELLPNEFRAFALALNALKQWVSAESLATDGYALGGNARNELRATATRCMITGEPLGEEIKLHHPVRDGRPPIPLSSAGHAKLEGQSPTESSDPRIAAIAKLKGNRSWVMLRRGCLDLLGRDPNHSTPKVAANSRTFARKAAEASGMTYEEILAWLGDD